MYLDELNYSGNLQNILAKLAICYKIQLNFDSIPNLVETYNHYSFIKDKILKESSYNSYCNHPEYTKAVLICEAIRIFLSEIAPGRAGKVVRRKKKITESELQPEMPKVKNGTDSYWDDAPMDADGEDMSDDYADDRKPNKDNTSIENDYVNFDKWIEDKFLIEPETGDTDETTEFSGSENPDEVNQEVAKKYYDTPGPTPSDYAADRNIEDISKMMDGPGYYEDDVIDKIEAMPETPLGDVTKTGLPSDLEKGVRSQNPGDRKNGVISNNFSQDPRNDKQREIPKPTDLQNQNNKEMYGKSFKNKTEVNEKFARQVFVKLNTAKYANKIFESVSLVSKENKSSIKNVLNSVRLYGKKMVDEKIGDVDPIYNRAMLYALELIENPSFKSILQAAQSDVTYSEKLYKFLINKAIEFGLKDRAKQFAMAAHNALLNANLDAFAKARQLF